MGELFKLKNKPYPPSPRLPNKPSTRLPHTLRPLGIQETCANQLVLQELFKDMVQTLVQMCTTLTILITITIKWKKRCNKDWKKRLRHYDCFFKSDVLSYYRSF